MRSAGTVFSVAHRVGHRIRVARQAAGLDRQQVARVLGVTSTALARVEAGDAREPLRVVLAALAHTEDLVDRASNLPHR